MTSYQLPALQTSPVEHVSKVVELTSESLWTALGFVCYYVAFAWTSNRTIPCHGRANIYEVHSNTRTGGKLLPGNNCHLAIL